MKLEIPQPSTPECTNMKYFDFSKDSLTIVEGADKKTYCGDTPNPSMYVTKGEALTISFKTDNSITKTGFRIEYTSTECKTLNQDNYRLFGNERKFINGC